MIKSGSTEEAKFVENELSGAVGRDFAPPGDRGFVCSLKQNDRISQCRFPDRPWLQPVTVNQIPSPCLLSFENQPPSSNSITTVTFCIQ